MKGIKEHKITGSRCGECRCCKESYLLGKKDLIDEIINDFPVGDLAFEKKLKELSFKTLKSIHTIK